MLRYGSLHSEHVAVAVSGEEGLKAWCTDLNHITNSEKQAVVYELENELTKRKLCILGPALCHDRAV